MPSFKDKIVIEDVCVVKQTDKALLYQIGGEEVWIPQGTLVASEWIANQKGLI